MSVASRRKEHQFINVTEPNLLEHTFDYSLPPLGTKLVVHLRRDFQAMIDRENSGSEFGKSLLELLTACCCARLDDSAAPSLLPAEAAV